MFPASLILSIVVRVRARAHLCETTFFNSCTTARNCQPFQGKTDSIIHPLRLIHSAYILIPVRQSSPDSPTIVVSRLSTIDLIDLQNEIEPWWSSADNRRISEWYLICWQVYGNGNDNGNPVDGRAPVRLSCRDSFATLFLLCIIFKFGYL